MKKISFIAIAFVAFSISSCKKDFTCECTHTHTNDQGKTDTDPMFNTTYRDMKKSQAKSLCQNSKNVSVAQNGGTTTDVYECKLK